MSRDIKDFVAGFSAGAGVGLGIRRQQMQERVINQKEGEPNSPELQEFDRANGTGVQQPGLLRRLGIWNGPPLRKQIGTVFNQDANKMRAPAVVAPAVDWGQGDTAYYEDGGLVVRNNQRQWIQDAQGRFIPVAPSSETGGAPEPNRTFTAYDDPTLDDQRRNMGDDGPYPDVPVTGRGDPVYNAPMQMYDNKIMGREGAVPLNTNPTTSVTPEGNTPSSTPEETAVPVGAGPGGKPVNGTVTVPKGRKALRDQTRTEAFDPDLDKDDPDNVVGKMLDGAMQFANHNFHLSGDGVAVGDDPNKVRGQRAFLTGVGAADPQDVQALDKIALQQNPGLDKAALAMKRMEIIYRHYVTTGQTEKANKVAFELLQYGAGEAARMGGQALQQFKSGDHRGATNTLVQAVDAIPDGNTAAVTPDGKNVVLTNGKGQQVNSIPITPENIFNYALGLSNKSMYWQVIAQRAALTSSAMQKATAGENRSALDAARIKLIEARTAKLQGGGKGGGGTAGLPAELKNALSAIEGVPTSEVTPGGTPAPEQGGGEPPIASGDDDEEDMGDIEQGGGDTPNGQPNAATLTQRTANKPAKGALPQYDEPHPLEKWKGKNPYSEVLGNPKFTGYFATKEGRAARSVIEARAREKNKEVAEYNKNKREFERNAKKEALAADKEDLAEAKGVFNQQDKSKQAAELFETIKAEVDPVRQEFAKAPPNIFNTDIVKPGTITDVAQSLATSNPNMPPNRALRIMGYLAHAEGGEGGEDQRSYNVLGTDRLGNYVVVPKSNPQQKITVRQETLNDIENMRLALQRKLATDRNKPSFGKRVSDALTSPGNTPPVNRPVKAKPRVIGEEPPAPAQAVEYPPVNLRIR